VTADNIENLILESINTRNNRMVKFENRIRELEDKMLSNQNNIKNLKTEEERLMTVMKNDLQLQINALKSVEDKRQKMPKTNN